MAALATLMLLMYSDKTDTQTQQMIWKRAKHSPTTRKDSTVPSSYSVQQFKVWTLRSPPRSLFLFPSSLCHLTSSGSLLVCLTDSKSPSLCPRSLCLPCPPPPPPPPLAPVTRSLPISLFMVSPTQALLLLLLLCGCVLAACSSLSTVSSSVSRIATSTLTPPLPLLCHTCRLSPPLGLALVSQSLSLHLLRSFFM